MKTATEIAALFASLNAVREKYIADNMATNPFTERFDHAIRYDTEIAPRTTNWQQLQMLGIDPDTASLCEIIDGLALWGIYFYGTNGLTDEQMLDRLRNKVLLDIVTLIPPCEDLNEFIDMSPFGVEKEVADRDAHLPRPKHNCDLRPTMEMVCDPTVDIIIQQDGFSMGSVKVAPENN